MIILTFEPVASTFISGFRFFFFDTKNNHIRYLLETSQTRMVSVRKSLKNFHLDQASVISFRSFVTKAQVHILLTLFSHRNIYMNIRKIFFFFALSVPPKWNPLPPPKKINIVIEYNKTLECNVDADPAPNVTWYKDGRPLESSK